MFYFSWKYSPRDNLYIYIYRTVVYKAEYTTKTHPHIDICIYKKHKEIISA